MKIGKLIVVLLFTICCTSNGDSERKANLSKQTTATAVVNQSISINTDRTDNLAREAYSLMLSAPTVTGNQNNTLRFGQNQELKFTTKFYDAVDKWVAFRTKEDSLYMAGFIYIDMQAGFTFCFETSFVITDNSLEKLTSYSDSMRLILRLGRNTADVAILTKKEIEQLGLPEEPDWLKSYGKSAGTNLHFVMLGLFYNSIRENHRAIESLLKVYNKNPHFYRLEYELAHAYNATKNFDKAIAVLNKAIKNDSKNYKFYKELGFSLIHQNKLTEAESVYLKGIELTTVKAQKAEMAHNMAFSYFQIRNRAKFEEWAKLTRKYADENSQFYRNMNSLERNWDK